jgi:hypothetical protein
MRSRASPSIVTRHQQPCEQSSIRYLLAALFTVPGHGSRAADINSAVRNAFSLPDDRIALRPPNWSIPPKSPIAHGATAVTELGQQSLTPVAQRCRIETGATDIKGVPIVIGMFSSNRSTMVLEEEEGWWE